MQAADVYNARTNLRNIAWREKSHKATSVQCEAGGSVRGRGCWQRGGEKVILGKRRPIPWELSAVLRLLFLVGAAEVGRMGSIYCPIGVGAGKAGCGQGGAWLRVRTGEGEQKSELTFFLRNNTNPKFMSNWHLDI